MKFLLFLFTLIPAVNSGVIDKSGCQVTKGCFPNPSKDQEPVFSWMINKNKNWMEIELEGPGDGNGYVAIGFSNYAHKGQDYIIECSKIGGGELTMRFSWNTDGPANQRIKDEETIEQSYFKNVSFRIMDSRAYCRGIVKIDGWSGSNLVLNVTNGTAYYYKYAYGTTDKNGLVPHHATATLASWDKIDMGEIVGEAREARGPPTNTKLRLKQAHAILMVLAWVCFIPSAMLFARFLKGSWSKTKPGGIAMWFHIHRTANILGIILTIASFICIMCAFDWKWTGPGSQAKYAYKVHSMLGLLALIFAWMQPLNSMLRCAPTDSRRPIFNWTHRLTGVVSYILATAALATAAYMFQSPSGVWTIGIQMEPGLKLALTLIPPAVIIVLCCVMPFLGLRENPKNKESIDRLKEGVIFLAVAIFTGDAVAMSVLIIP